MSGVLPDLDDVHGLSHRDGQTAAGEAGHHPEHQGLPPSGGLAHPGPAEQFVPQSLVQSDPEGGEDCLSLESWSQPTVQSRDALQPGWQNGKFVC